MNGASILLPALGGGSPAGINGGRRAKACWPVVTRELGWDEAKRMIGTVGTMDDAAFQRWHAQTLAKLAETLEPTALVKKATGRSTRRLLDR